MARAYDSIIVLAGGRHPDGRLTDLTTQRLDKGASLFRSGRAPAILVMSGHYATWSPRAIRFPDVQAILAKQYLVSRGIPNDVIVAEADDTVRDTITEALVARRVHRTKCWGSSVLVTSDKHIPRAKMIFDRVFAGAAELDATGAPCGDLLDADREARYHDIAAEYLMHLPDAIPEPADWRSWFQANRELYENYAAVDAEFKVQGHEASQAYAAQQED